MGRVEEALAAEFVCHRCKNRGAKVEKLAMSGIGVSHMFNVEMYYDAFASCVNCGYTEVYNLDTLEAKPDLRAFLSTLYGGKAWQR